MALLCETCKLNGVDISPVVLWEAFTVLAENPGRAAAILQAESDQLVSPDDLPPRNVLELEKATPEELAKTRAVVTCWLRRHVTGECPNGPDYEYARADFT